MEPVQPDAAPDNDPARSRTSPVDPTLQPADRAPLTAGDFDHWLLAMTASLEGRQGSDVPCGDCRACCRAGYFIAVTPDDEAARRRIPAALIFPAPGAPAGHNLLPHNEAGACPMLETAGCSIYPDRPFTCRQYDCRVFAATGIVDSESHRTEVMAQARRWRFDFSSDAARERQQHLAAGAAFLRREGKQLHEAVPSDATQLALLAIKLLPVFATLGGRLHDPSAATRKTVVDAVRAVYSG